VLHGAGAYFRDLWQLEGAQAVRLERSASGRGGDCFVSINYDWPQEIDEGEFLRRMRAKRKGGCQGGGVRGL